MASRANTRTLRSDRRAHRGDSASSVGKVAARSARRGAWDVRVAVLAVLLAAAAFVAFLPALECGFNFDDEKIITDNENFRGLTWPNLRWMFSTFLMGHYHPLTWISLAVDYHFWGMEPWGYHLTNMLLHAANAGLVFLLLLRLMSRASRGKETDAPDRRPWREICGAALGALLFAVHPLRVESVAWVTERRDVLSSFWLLCTVLLYLRAQTVVDRSVQRRCFAASFVAYVLSLLSRAMGVTLPVILLFLDWYPLRRIGGPRTWAAPDQRRVIVEKLWYLVPAIVFAVIAPTAQTRTGAAIELDRLGVLERFAQAAYGLVFYVQKTLLPVGLAPFYELRLPLEILSAKYLASFAAVIAAVITVVLMRRSRPALTVAAAAYAILLSPVLGFFQSGQQEVADRYSYLPAICISALVAGLIVHWCARRETRASGATIAWLVLLAVCVMTPLTWRQCRIWKTPLSLWEHGVACQPDSYWPAYNLGCALAKSDQTQKAIDTFERVLKLEPRHVSARFNLGNAFQEQGRWADALDQYDRLLERHPDDHLAHYEKGRVLLHLERFAEAEASFIAALRLRPEYPKASVNLGVALARQGRHEEAVERFNVAVELQGELRDAFYNLGISLEALGRSDEALDAYQKAVIADPGFPDARVNLGNVFLRKGRAEDARKQYEAALKLSPNHPAARANLDALNRRLGVKP